MKIEENELPHLASVWSAVKSLVPGALITGVEEGDYITDVLSPERLAIVEELLAETPKYRARLRKFRGEYRRRAQELHASESKILMFVDTRPAWESLLAAARVGEVVTAWDLDHYRQLPVAGGRAVAEIEEACGGAWCRLRVESKDPSLRGARLDFDFGGVAKGSLNLSVVGSVFSGQADIAASWADLDFARARIEHPEAN